jgi:hypothetical protein
VNWNKLTYQQKNKVLLVGYLIFLFAAYQLAISKSWELYTQNKELEEKINSSSSNYRGKEELEKKRQLLDHRISSFFVDSVSHQDYLLGTISTYCNQHHVLIKEIPAMSKYIEDDFEVGTYKVVLEGDFIPLLKMVYLLEQKNKMGRISSVLFSLKYDNKRKKEILSMILYIQNIQLYAHEEKE